jgi:hypothetical protein
VALGIFDLHERPHHADAVADRIWKAFWRHKGTPLVRIRDVIDAILKSEGGVPFALVAESEGRPCGNALVIDNDEPAKPDLAPWACHGFISIRVRRCRIFTRPAAGGSWSAAWVRRASRSMTGNWTGCRHR